MRRLAIVTATGKELRAAVDGAPRISSPEPVAWRWRGLDLFLVTSGTGPVNAAWGLGRLLERRQELLGVLNIGIAGSFDPKALPLLSTVLVREEIWPEFGLRTAGGVDPAGVKYAQGTLEGQEVRDRVGLSPQRALARLGVRLPLPWPEGRSLTVAGVTGDAELAREHRRLYSPDVENMEGFALAWPCLKYGVPFAEVRCVSNPVGSRLSRDWDVQGALGQLNSAMKTLVESMG